MCVYIYVSVNCLVQVQVMHPTEFALNLGTWLLSLSHGVCCQGSFALGSSSVRCSRRSTSKRNRSRNSPAARLHGIKYLQVPSAKMCHNVPRCAEMRQVFAKCPCSSIVFNQKPWNLEARATLGCKVWRCSARLSIWDSLHVLQVPMWFFLCFVGCSG